MLNLIADYLLCSIVAAAAGLLYMLLQPLIEKKVTARWRYLGWVVIIIAFLIPVRPHFPDTTIVAELPATDQIVVYQSGTRPKESSHLPSAARNISEQSGSSVPKYVTLTDSILFVWAAVVLMKVLWYSGRHRQFRRMIRRWSSVCEDTDITEAFQDAKDNCGITKDIKLKYCACIEGPMLTGIFIPEVLLPEKQFDNEELKLILLHELTHYKRRDLWTKGLVLLAAILHWFNPFMILMKREMELQCEIACDEEILLRADIQGRLKYIETILKLAGSNSKHSPVLSADFYGGKSHMKKRIKGIMDTKKKRTGIFIVCILIMTFLISGTVFAFQSDSDLYKRTFLNSGVTTSSSMDAIGSDDTEFEAELIAALGEDYKDMTIAQYEAAINKLYELSPSGILEEGVLAEDFNEDSISSIYGQYFQIGEKDAVLGIAYAYQIRDKANMTLRQRDELIESYINSFEGVLKQMKSVDLTQDGIWLKMEQHLKEYIAANQHDNFSFTEFYAEYYEVEGKVLYEIKYENPEVDYKKMAEEMGYKYVKMNCLQDDMTDDMYVNQYNKYNFTYKDGVVFEFSDNSYLIMHPNEDGVIPVSATCSDGINAAKLWLKIDEMQKIPDKKLAKLETQADDVILETITGKTFKSEEDMEQQIKQQLSDKFDIKQSYMVVECSFIAE